MIRKNKPEKETQKKQNTAHAYAVYKQKDMTGEMKGK